MWRADGKWCLILLHSVFSPYGQVIKLQLADSDYLVSRPTLTSWLHRVAQTRKCTMYTGLRSVNFIVCGQCAEHQTGRTLGDIELSTNRHKYRVWSHLIHWGMGRFCFIFLASFCFMRKVFRADIMPTYFLSGKNDYLAFLCNCKQSYNERMVTILSIVTPSLSGLQNLKS